MMRKCQRCGKTFEPKPANQRVCPECLFEPDMGDIKIAEPEYRIKGVGFVSKKKERTCIDCGVSIEDRNKLAIRCKECAAKKVAETAKEQYRKKKEAKEVETMNIIKKEERVGRIVTQPTPIFAEAGAALRSAMQDVHKTLKGVPLGTVQIVEDAINPDHNKIGGIEAIDALKAQLTAKEFEGYLKGTLMKYMMRAGHKDAKLQDYKKAQWFMNRLVKEAECE